MRLTPYIDPSFRESVVRHIVGNFLLEESPSPLILAVFGPPGEGKTFQVEQICTELGIHQSLISPGELESENAGHPGQLMRREYLKASQRYRDGVPTVLVVHDLDTVLGDWGKLVQYTVNRQIIYAQLMAFCDFPKSVSGNITERVPIIVTGNDPSTLHGPLLRPGRSRLMTWRPNPAERAPVVAGLFPELDPRGIEGLVAAFPHQPVSFWADIRASIWESHVGIWASGRQARELSDLISRGRKIRLSNVELSLDLVKHTAVELMESRRVSDQP